MEQKKTVSDLATEQGVHSKTIQRWISKGQTFPEWCNLVEISKDDSFPPSATLPLKVYWYLKRVNGYPEPPFRANLAFPDGGQAFQPGGKEISGEKLSFRMGGQSTIQSGQRPILPPKDPGEFARPFRELTRQLETIGQTYGPFTDEELADLDKEELPTDKEFRSNIQWDNVTVNTEPRPDKVKEELDKATSKFGRNVGTCKPTEQVAPAKLSERILNRDLFPVVSMAILILSDCVSFGWIAWNTFTAEFQIPAAIFFSAAGFSVAYSAIKNAVSYKGQEADAWLIGFGLLQFGLHMAAMGMFGSWSWTIGKAVISVSIPMATIGIALTYRKSNQ